MKHARPTVLYAAAVRDAMGVNASPGAVLVLDGKVVAAGQPGSLPRELVEQAEVIHCDQFILLPAFVNAHMHLELTNLGPQPYAPPHGFVGWVKMVRHRIAIADQFDDGMMSYNKGMEMLRDACVSAVGDITKSTLMFNSPFCTLSGQCYEEQFGLTDPLINQALKNIRAGNSGIQPHAPYSAGPSVYAAAADSGRPVSTHLAEHEEEIAFVADLAGPMVAYLSEIGRWDNSIGQHYGKGLSPVQWMRPYLKASANDGGWLVAHCNYVSNDDIKILADTNTSVAYCPIASEYFGHKDHRYCDMLDAGVNVCLGTDSIICADPDDPQPLGLLSSMRRLHERDQTDPDTLLAMATTHGAKALRLDATVATLQPGAPARFACIPIDPKSDVDPLVQVLSGQDPVQAISFQM